VLTYVFATGFNCKVLYHNRNRRPEVEAELGVEYASKDELLAQSDTVIVIVSTTDVVIDAAALKKMKPTASLVNVARGPTVDTEALTAALQAGEIAGAGLDVLDPEPPPTDHPIYSLNNVILAPHRGSATVKTRRAMAQLCVDNLLAGIEGRELPAQAN
jgi:lactate dehydrogenase-like 2-hydroxyacid dehydrogenase